MEDNQEYINMALEILDTDDRGLTSLEIDFLDDMLRQETLLTTP